MSSLQPAVIGLFAGVGGIEEGFRIAGFKPIAANELDEYAAQTYRHLHSLDPLVRDIHSVSGDELLKGRESNVESLVLTGGFPCQPFSVAGYRKGFDDERGNVYWEIHRLINELKPDVVFLENVKNLETHDSGQTLKTILASLRGEIAAPNADLDINYGKLYAPYFVPKPKILNAKDFGIPQNRERLFIVAFKDAGVAERFEFPEPVSNGSSHSLLADFIDFDQEKDSKYYYDNKRPFFDKLENAITSQNTVYQWRRQYVRANKSGLCPTLTANMGTGGHNVPLIRTSDGRIRKLTPAECFKLMGFKDVDLPSFLPDSKLYKQAGNAVVVPVIAAIAESIKKAME